MNRSYTSVLVIILILIGSAFVMFVAPPDRVSLISQDRDFRFYGSVADVNLRVETEQGSSSTARVRPIYQVSPDTLLAGEGVVSIKSVENVVGLSLARYSEEKLAWELLPTEYSRDEFSARTPRTGSFTLLKAHNVVVPDKYRNLVSRLIAGAPIEAEAARFQYAYALVENDFVLVPGTSLQDGCGGRFTASTIDVSTGFLSETAVININGVDLEGWQGVSVEWMLGKGCGEDEFALK
ncbi:MAG: hypothetical protein O2877_01755 [bacterium]|nr:hypothetical protein [bacterium]